MERKQLLGAVFDEIEHHFKLFTRERNLYLGLAAVAGVSLLTAIIVLATRPSVHPALAVAILGGSGLIAFAAARSSAFFHGAISAVEDLVKRHSKISEPEMVSTVSTLTKQSEVSQMLMIAGMMVVAGCVAFTLARVWVVSKAVDVANEEIDRAQTKASAWEHSFRGAQQDYATLKASVTALYPAHVTPDHQVIGVRTGVEQATVQPKRGAAPAGHSFTLALHSTPAALSSLKRVSYRIRYTEEQTLAGKDATNGFTVSYVGPGCLSQVDVSLERPDGSTEAIAFDQCRSLGPGWTPFVLPSATEPASP